MRINKRSIVGLIDLKNMILIVIGAFVLIAFLMFFFKQVNNNAPEKACQLNVNLFYNNLRLNLPGIGKAGLSYPACKPIKKEISFSEDNKDEFYNQISQLIVNCWRMYGSGIDSNVFYDKLRDNKRCSLCYIVNININNQNKLKFSSSELLKYMASNYVVSKIENINNKENKKGKEAGNEDKMQYKSFLNDITNNNGDILIFTGGSSNIDNMKLEKDKEINTNILYIFYVSKLRVNDNINSYILLSTTQDNVPCDVIDN